MIKIANQKQNPFPTRTIINPRKTVLRIKNGEQQSGKQTIFFALEPRSQAILYPNNKVGASKGGSSSIIHGQQQQQQQQQQQRLNRLPPRRSNQLRPGFSSFLSDHAGRPTHAHVVTAAIVVVSECILACCQKGITFRRRTNQ